MTVRTQELQNHRILQNNRILQSPERSLITALNTSRSAAHSTALNIALKKPQRTALNTAQSTALNTALSTALLTSLITALGTAAGGPFDDASHFLTPHLDKSYSLLLIDLNHRAHTEIIEPTHIEPHTSPTHSTSSQNRVGASHLRAHTQSPHTKPNNEALSYIRLSPHTLPASKQNRSSNHTAYSESHLHRAHSQSSFTEHSHRDLPSRPPIKPPSLQTHSYREPTRGPPPLALGGVGREARAHPRRRTPGCLARGCSGGA